jgi:hypothetical protein
MHPRDTRGRRRRGAARTPRSSRLAGNGSASGKSQRELSRVRARTRDARWRSASTAEGTAEGAQKQRLSSTGTFCRVGTWCGLSPSLSPLRHDVFLYVNVIAIMQSRITLPHGRAAMLDFLPPSLSPFRSVWGASEEPPQPPSVPPRPKGRSLQPGPKMATDIDAMGGARRATAIQWPDLPRRDMVRPLALPVNTQARCFLYFYGELKPSI